MTVQSEDGSRAAGRLSAPNGLPAAALTGDGVNEVRVTFLAENSISADTLGAYRIEEDGRIGEVRILFANADADGSARGQVGVAEGDVASLGVLEEGERWGLFLLNNGFSEANAGLFSDDGAFAFVRPQSGEPASIGDQTPPELVFTGADGQAREVRGVVFHSADVTPETPGENRLNVDDRGHVASSPEEGGAVLVGFADQSDGGPDDIDRGTPALTARIDRVNGFEVAGDPETGFGRSLDAIGDVNGDGREDFVVGAPLTGEDRAGAAYVVFGSTEHDAIDPAALERGEGGFAIQGAPAGALAGFEVTNAGDFDGDGVGDFAISAPGNGSEGGEPRSGGAWVIYGRADLDAVDLGDLGSDGFAIVTGDPDLRGLGLSLSGGGDFDGDGFDDLLIGAPNGQINDDDGAPGTGFLLRGGARSEDFDVATATAGLGQRTPDYIDDAFVAYDLGGPLAGIGRDLDFLGDVDGDGFDDFYVGYAGEDDPTGRIYFGGDTPFSTEGYVNRSTALDAGGEFRGPASAIGDFDGDGLDDFVLPASNENGAGAPAIVFGRSGEDAGAFAIDARLATDGLAGGQPVETAIGPAGDVNGDGLADIVVAATVGDGELDNSARIVFGRAERGDIDLASDEGAQPLDLGELVAQGGDLDDAVAGSIPDFFARQSPIGGDFDGDGAVDFAQASPGESRISVAFADPDADLEDESAAAEPASEDILELTPAEMIAPPTLELTREMVAAAPILDEAPVADIATDGMASAAMVDAIT